MPGIVSSEIAISSGKSLIHCHNSGILKVTSDCNRIAASLSFAVESSCLSDVGGPLLQIRNEELPTLQISGTVEVDMCNVSMTTQPAELNSDMTAVSGPVDHAIQATLSREIPVMPVTGAPGGVGSGGGSLGYQSS